MLRKLDLDFEVRLKEVEEIYPNYLKGGEITAFLSELKSAAFAQELKPRDILITSDTLVWLDGAALGKPSSPEDALEMLRKLSGKTHEVMTSVTFATTEKTQTITETTRVTFNALTDEDMRYYLRKHKPFDKAGSYGIQDWIGLVAVAKIEGSYANVMGLPVDKVYQFLCEQL